MHIVNRHYSQLTAPGGLNISHSNQPYRMKLKCRNKCMRRDSVGKKCFLIMQCPLSVTDCPPNSPQLNQPASLLWKQTSSCTPRILLIWYTGVLVCIFQLSSGSFLCQRGCIGGIKKKINPYFTKEIFCLLSRVTAATGQRTRHCFKPFTINFVNNEVTLETTS